MKYFIKEAGIADKAKKGFEYAKSIGRTNKEALTGAAVLGPYMGHLTHTEEKKKTKTRKNYKYNRANVIGNTVAGGIVGAYLGQTYKDLGNTRRRYSYYDRGSAGSGGSTGFSGTKSVGTDGYLNWLDVTKKTMKSKKDVKSAYRAAARKYHPDLNQAIPGNKKSMANAEEAEKRMKKASEAYEKLKGDRWFEGLKQAMLKEPGIWGNARASGRALRENENGTINTGLFAKANQDYKDNYRPKSPMRKFVGEIVPTAIGGAIGNIAMKKGNASLAVGAMGAGAIGTYAMVIKDVIDESRAQAKYIKTKGFKVDPQGLITGMSSEAKKKYLDDKYEGGGFNKADNKARQRVFKNKK